jgi:hypothetical protein
MSGRFSDFVITGWIDELETMDLFAALCATNPLVGDPLAAELAGGDYHRQDLLITREAFNLWSNTELIYWLELPPGTHIAWIAAFDANINGHLVAAAPLDDPIDLAAGGAFPLDPGDFAFGLDVAVGP